jgi:hypothetical protein
MFYRVDYVPAIDDSVFVGLKKAVFVGIRWVCVSDMMYKVIDQDGICM